MTARILGGQASAATIRADVKRRVTALAPREVLPGSGTVLVGSDPGSRVYATGQHRDCALDIAAHTRRADVVAAARCPG